MGRPFKCRKIGCRPGVSLFRPCGVPACRLGEVVLTVDEFESLRLADLEGMYQDAAAECMHVSRQTFGNIVNAARRKVADALVNGKRIQINGGVYQVAQMKTFQCSDCGHTWQRPYGTGRPQACPQCNRADIHRAVEDRGPARHRCGRGRCGRIAT